MPVIPGFRPTNNFGNLRSSTPITQSTAVKPHSIKEKELYQGLFYHADTSGCGFYRIFWPNMLLTGSQNFILNHLNKLIPLDKWYEGVDFVKIQRQVSPEQLVGVRLLRQICDKFNIRLIYEIDDLPFYEDIPKYNRHHVAYSDPKLVHSVREIMNMCDEIVTTTPFFCEHLKTKVTNRNITAVPNFVPNFWMGRFYDENTLKNNFNKNKKKPRILYPGSGAHYAGDTTLKDDFSHLVDLVRKTHKEFQWVFFGGAPRQLVDLIRNGKVEYHPWVNTMKAPQKIFDLRANVIIAPLDNNVFNQCKSDIKFTESSAMGIPSVCQDLVTYKNAINKFEKADDLYQQLKRITTDAGVYMKESRKARMYMNGNFMEDRLDVWAESLKYPFGSEKRVNLNQFQ